MAKQVLPGAPFLIVGAPVFGVPTLRSLAAASLTVASPVFGELIIQRGFLDPLGITTAPAEAGIAIQYTTVLKPIDDSIGSPVIGQPLLRRYIRPTDPFVIGSPVLGTPRFRMQRILGSISTEAGAPVFGDPWFFINYHLTLPPAVGLVAGSEDLEAPALGLQINLSAWSLQVGAPVFGSPYYTQRFAGVGDLRGLPAEPSKATPYFREINAIWPDLLNQRAIISPARNGVNRETGRLLQGWEHVEQSMKVIFATPFHERILRRWVGSYVPYILGETYVARIVTRFFWAISVSIDLWEPNYRIKQVFYMGDALSKWSPKILDAVGEYRLGHGIFRTEGVYRPRAHLGDASPYQPRAVALVGNGTEIWDPALAQP